MARLSALPARIASVKPRLVAASSDRQATRDLATNSSAWRRLRAQVLLRDNYTCQNKACGRVAGKKGEAHVDHIDGNSRNNAMSNLQTLCAPCHSRKTAQHDGGFGNAPRN